MIGTTLGHYTLLEEIGAGGMGRVYRAMDERLEREVAIKILPAGALADPEARKRFRKEALALSKLNHPNIATVHDFDRQEETDFLVMEHIEGVTLAEKLAHGALAEKEVLRLGLQLAEGLAAARKVSAAASSTLLPCERSRLASLPMVVVLPVPFTPTTSKTSGGSTVLGGRSAAVRMASSSCCNRRLSSGTSAIWRRSAFSRSFSRTS